MAISKHDYWNEMVTLYNKSSFVTLRFIKKLLTNLMINIIININIFIHLQSMVQYFF